MSLKLTSQQQKALKFLRDDKEYGDLVYEQGAGWWLGTNKTNGKLAMNLIRLCLVTKVDASSVTKYERWEINDSGRRILEGKLPYRKNDGTYTDDLCKILGN